MVHIALVTIQFKLHFKVALLAHRSRPIALAVSTDFRAGQVEFILPFADPLITAVALLGGPRLNDLMPRSVIDLELLGSFDFFGSH